MSLVHTLSVSILLYRPIQYILTRYFAISSCCIHYFGCCKHPIYTQRSICFILDYFVLVIKKRISFTPSRSVISIDFHLFNTITNYQPQLWQGYTVRITPVTNIDSGEEKVTVHEHGRTFNLTVGGGATHITFLKSNCWRAHKQNPPKLYSCRGYV